MQNILHEKTKEPYHEYNHTFQQDRLSFFILLLLCAPILYIMNDYVQDPAHEVPFPTGKTSEKVMVPTNSDDNSSVRVSMEEDRVFRHGAELIQIQGDLLAGERLKFKLMNTHPAATYSLDFGRGTTQDIKDASIYFRYPEPGTYIVNLRCKYRGKSKVIGKRKIHVKPAIQMIGSLEEMPY